MITSISFPNMFSTGSTKVKYDRDATKQNLLLLLMATKYSLLGEPNFGTNIKKLIFEQNSNILRDIVIDEIHSNIQIFLPQIKVQREDIELVAQGNTLYVNVKARNMIDYSFEDISLALYALEETA